MRHFLLMTLLASLATPAMAIYKCDSGGKISYSDAPCINGRSAKLDESLENTPTSRDIANARKLAEQDKARLLKLEREKLQRDAKEEKERQRLMRAGTNQRKKCADLALQKRWAEEDAASAKDKLGQKARINARRKAEKYALLCGN